ncbi:MAG: AhpC/TSA family protein [Saprospirales bacterium]|nr:AhpC/TSA family protein [Saprospirales bacterium]
MQKTPSVVQPPAVWTEMLSQNEESLALLTEQSPVLLVFLRHFGCSFCREAISDIAKRRNRLEKRGVRIVMVHMANEPGLAEKFFHKYKLWPIDYISDPEKRLYRAFELGRGTPAQLFGLMNWIRGFEAGILEGHGFASPGEEYGDGFQMPGVFVLHKGEIKHSFIHRHAWDRPDYEEIVNSCEI